MSLLNVTDLTAAYGNIQALKGINFSVDEGEIVAIIGANGAGKTTLLSCISGIMPYKGTIEFEGADIRNLGTDKIVQTGIVQVPEGRQIFSELSVQENLKMGAYGRKKGEDIKLDLNRVLELFPRLQERMYQKGGSLSGGEQQMLAVARALMSKPKLLLMDEPSMGLAPVIVADIFKIIQQLHREGITIVLIEQNAKLALKHANRAYVLETGEVMLHGEAAQLADNAMIKELYLGG